MALKKAQRTVHILYNGTIVVRRLGRHRDLFAAVEVERNDRGQDEEEANQKSRRHDERVSPFFTIRTANRPRVTSNLND